MSKIALISKIISSAPSIAKGISNAISKVGKEVFNKNAKNIPSVVRHNRLKKSFKAGDKQKAKTAANTKAGEKVTGTAKDIPRLKNEDYVTGPYTKKIKKTIPDRRTLLGKAGYNYQYLSNGGSVNSRAIAKKYFKGTF